MTSLGFAESLNPYEETPADAACVLLGGCLITEKNPFDRMIIGITDGCVIGWKYYDFGTSSGSDRTIHISTEGCGCSGKIHITIDAPDGEEIGCADFGANGGIVSAKVRPISGRHAVFLRAVQSYSGWAADMFKGRELFRLNKIIFTQ